MADKKKGLGLKQTTKIATPELAKKLEIKPSIVNDAVIEKTVDSIHSSTSKMTRLSLDVTPDMYDKIKRRQLDKGIKTTREYLVQLVKQDIE